LNLKSDRDLGAVVPELGTGLRGGHRSSGEASSACESKMQAECRGGAEVHTRSHLRGRFSEVASPRSHLRGRGGLPAWQWPQTRSAEPHSRTPLENKYRVRMIHDVQRIGGKGVGRTVSILGQAGGRSAGGGLIVATCVRARCNCPRLVRDWSDRATKRKGIR
jgi:hypothetical protein